MEGAPLQTCIPATEQCTISAVPIGISTGGRTTTSGSDRAGGIF